MKRSTNNFVEKYESHNIAIIIIIIVLKCIWQDFSTRLKLLYYELRKKVTSIQLDVNTITLKEILG